MDPIEWAIAIALLIGSTIGMNWVSSNDPGYQYNCGQKVYY